MLPQKSERVQGMDTWETQEQQSPSLTLVPFELEFQKKKGRKGFKGQAWCQINRYRKWNFLLMFFHQQKVSSHPIVIHELWRLVLVVLKVGGK